MFANYLYYFLQECSGQSQTGSDACVYCAILTVILFPWFNCLTCIFLLIHVILTSDLHFVCLKVEGVCNELGELDVVVMSTLSIVMEMLSKVRTSLYKCAVCNFPYLHSSNCFLLTSLLSFIHSIV